MATLACLRCGKEQGVISGYCRDCMSGSRKNRCKGCRNCMIVKRPWFMGSKSGDYSCSCGLCFWSSIEEGKRKDG